MSLHCTKLKWDILLSPLCEFKRGNKHAFVSSISTFTPRRSFSSVGETEDVGRWRQVDSHCTESSTENCWETVIILRNCQLKDKVDRECTEKWLKGLFLSFLLLHLDKGSQLSFIVKWRRKPDISSINIPHRGHESSRICLRTLGIVCT